MAMLNVKLPLSEKLLAWLNSSQINTSRARDGRLYDVKYPASQRVRAWLDSLEGDYGQLSD